MQQHGDEFLSAYDDVELARSLQIAQQDGLRPVLGRDCVTDRREEGAEAGGILYQNMYAVAMPPVGPGSVITRSLKPSPSTSPIAMTLPPMTLALSV